MGTPLAGREKDNCLKTLDDLSWKYENCHLERWSFMKVWTLSFRKRRNPVGHSFMNVWTNKLLRVGGKIPKHSAVASYKLKSGTITFSMKFNFYQPQQEKYKIHSLEWQLREMYFVSWISCAIRETLHQSIMKPQMLVVWRWQARDFENVYFQEDR